MKIFNTLKELWDYCLFCPICQKDCRKIELSLVDGQYNLILFEKKDDNLLLYLEKYEDIPISQNILYDNKRHTISCNINMVTGQSYDDPALLQDLFFWITGICYDCNFTSGASEDIILNEDGYFSNFKMELENVDLIDDGSYINIEYCKNTLYITTKAQSLRPQTIKLPMYEFDFSNLEKTRQKIKKILLLS